MPSTTTNAGSISFVVIAKGLIKVFGYPFSFVLAFSNKAAGQG